MKFKTFLSVALSLFMGCSSAVVTDFSADVESHDLDSIIVCSRSAESRIAIDSSNNIWSFEWEVGDKLAGCSTNRADCFTRSIGDADSSTATFVGSSTSDLVRLVYPHCEGMVEGDRCRVDLSEQSIDLNDPTSSVADNIYLMSEDWVDLTSGSPAAYMQQVGALLKLNLSFTDLDPAYLYRVEQIRLCDLPTAAWLDLAATDISQALVESSEGDIVIEVANAEALKLDQIYTLYSAVLPFTLAGGESLKFVVRFSKTDSEGAQSRFDCTYSVANNTEGVVEFERAKYHTIKKLCSVDVIANVGVDISDMEYRYSDDTLSKNFDGVDFNLYYLARYVKAAPLQFKAKVGNIYNTSPMEFLSEIVINTPADDDYSRHELTLYVGTAVNPIETIVLPTEEGTRVTFSIPNGYSYFTLCNHSDYAAYALDITISYGTAYGGLIGEEQGGDSGAGEEPNPDLDAMDENSPYNVAYKSRWAEVPTYVGAHDYEYVTHFAPLNDESIVRNYSICFDPANRAALWVAFPYHEIYNGDSSRTDDWGFDPLISEELQAAIDSSYASYNGKDYDRGHQISSGDRLASDELNSQTFYYSNMTPQNSSLNRGQWSSLEDKVRAQVCADTLYVVTGAYYGETLGSTTDDESQECTIPSAYFKVMMRTRAGDSGKAISECSADELQSIGYWVENIYTGALPAPVSVSEIESKTGITFFPTATAADKSQCARALWSGL